MAPAPRPNSRDDFEVAIICALPLEYDAVTLIFDEFWDDDGDSFGRARGDTNTYTTGRIGKHNVVLALQPHMGKANAASAAANLRSSYGCLRLALLVGVCGGVPRAGGDEHEEILLGDVVISKQVVQFDFGRQYPDRFERKDTAGDNLSMPNKDVASLLATFQTENGLNRLEQRTSGYLRELQAKAARESRQCRYPYPGWKNDRLFSPDYRHKHRRVPQSCICHGCLTTTDPVCKEAIESSCDTLGCELDNLVTRKQIEAKRLTEDVDHVQKPAIHIGSIASGDRVMKSGEERDRIAGKENIIAFEMEGAGVWEVIPCLVVKGVCDYADCHKNKEWQTFAAATAAAAARAILGRYIKMDRLAPGMLGIAESSTACRHDAPRSDLIVPIISDTRGNGGPSAPSALTASSPLKPCSTVPFGPDPNFIDRPDILEWMRTRITRPPGRIALVGLGGIGKSQLAIHYAQSIRQSSPDTWVFWVHAGTAERFKQGYQGIAETLQIPGRDNSNANIPQLVYTWLCKEQNGRWLLILDNADDAAVFYSSQPQLAAYIPQSTKGSVVITSRSKDVTQRLTGDFHQLLEIPEMSSEQACQLLREKLSDNYDESAGSGLARTLNCMPLALTQAAAFVNRRTLRMTISKYLGEFHGSQSKRESLLHRDMGDLRRDPSAKNSVVTTWQITFEQIQREQPSAANLLSFMSFFNPQGIPDWALQKYYDWEWDETMVDFDEDIEMLRGYSLVKITEEGDMFEMHPLVQYCTQIWLKAHSKAGRWQRHFLWAMAGLHPAGDFDNWDRCKQLEPHIATLIGRDMQQPEYGEDAEKWAELLDCAGWYRCQRGGYKEAEDMLRRAVQTRVGLWGTDHRNTLRSMANHADVLVDTGKFDEAGELGRQVLKTAERLLGQDDQTTLKGMFTLARLAECQGRYDEAEQWYLDMLSKLKGKEPAVEDDNYTLNTRNNLAGVYSIQDRHDEAEQLYRHVMEARLKTLGQDHQNTLSSMSNLAIELRCLGRHEESEKLQRQTLARQRQVLGHEDPDTLKGMSSLGIILVDQEQYDEAEQLYRQALELQRKVLGEDNQDTLITAHNLAGLLHYELGRTGEASGYCDWAYSGKLKVFGPDHPSTVRSRDLDRDIRQAMENGNLPSAAESTSLPSVTATPARKVYRVSLRRQRVRFKH